LGAVSPNQNLSDPVYAAADLLAVGAATDQATQGSVENSTVFFGIATAGPWTTPQTFLIDFEVLIDSYRDGVIDYVLVNGTDGGLAAGNLFFPDDANDVFITVVRDVFFGGLISGGPLNLYPADQRDTAPFNNSVLVLSVPAAAIELTNGDGRFNYKVVTRGPDGFSLIDQTEWIPFDAGNPAVDTAVFGLGGFPTRDDGQPIEVMVHRSAAAVGGFSPAHPLRALVLHHFNPFERRFEIVKLDLDNEDTDGDGLRDVWEIEQFQDLVTADSTGDRDGDGSADLMETLAGTDPDDATSLFKILSASAVSGNGVAVRWTSVAGKSYTLERSTNLETGSFTPIRSQVSATPPVRIPFPIPRPLCSQLIKDDSSYLSDKSEHCRRSPELNLHSVNARRLSIEPRHEVRRDDDELLETVRDLRFSGCGDTLPLAMPAELAVAERKYITVADYLEDEKSSEVRHEYFDGELQAMAGASDEHELVAMNLAAMLHAHLKGKPCRVFKDGMKLRMPMMGRDLFYYPDVMVACDPDDRHRYYREKPKLLIEVLSEDENKDLVEKFLAYQRIPSLEEYVVVNPDFAKPEVRIFRRTEGWEPGELHHDGEFTLRSIGLTIKTSAVYET